MVELGADAHERAARIEGAPKELEQGGALFEDLQEPTVRLEFLIADVVEEAGCAADVQALLVLRRAAEGRTQGLEELAFLRRQLGIGQTLADDAGAELVFFNDTATTVIYTLSLHDALPI